MEFLEELGYTKEEINEVISSLPDAVYTNVIFNSERITDVINYFKSIGINNIIELLKEEISIFFIDINDIKNKIESLDNKEKFINLVNNDYLSIETIF